MVYAEKGKEQESFIAFIEHALGILSAENYSSFLAQFDSSRLSEQDLIRPVLKVDNPVLVTNRYQEECLAPFSDGGGFYLDYDLTTNGVGNDLTIQVEFLKEGDGYRVILEDLHTL